MSQYAPLCEKQTEYIRNAISPNNWLCVLEGGKRAGKNIINIIAWCAILEEHPDRLHLAAGVSVATAKLNIIDSNGFGVQHYFKGRCKEGKFKDRDALYIKTKTGEKIVLISGGGKAGDERYIKGLTLGSVYISEVNECADKFVKETFDRTISSQQRKILFDLNPKSELHWFYQEILDVYEKKQNDNRGFGYLYEHMTIADNMSMSDERIREVLDTYDKNSIWYLRDILGLRKNVEGLVYDCFNNSMIKEWTTDNLWYTRDYSIDYGTINPFGCLECIEQTINHEITWWVVNEFYYDSRKEKRQRTDNEHAVELKKFINNKRYKNIIVDPSAASFKAELRKTLLKPTETDKEINADNQVLNGIRLVMDLLVKHRLFISPKCVNLIRELNSYIWDSKASERGVEKVVKENDHLCITGDTLIDTIDGQIPIKQLTGKETYVWCYDEETQRKEISLAHDACMTQKNVDVYKITLSNGKTLTGTYNHPILTTKGWVSLIDSVGLMTANSYEIIESIAMAGKADVYNMEVDKYHNYSVEGGLIIHNCDALRYYCRTRIKNYKI